MQDIFEKIQNDFNEFMKQAKELVEKERVAKASKTKRWKPEVGDVFYIINYAGVVIECGNTNEVEVNACFHFGNCFKTKEEARKELDRRIAEQELLNLCDWTGKEEKAYVIDYDVKTDKFDWNWFYEITSPYRFASEESCKRAIDTLGSDKLKLIFRID